MFSTSRPNIYCILYSNYLVSLYSACTGGEKCYSITFRIRTGAVWCVFNYILRHPMFYILPATGH